MPSLRIHAVKGGLSWGLLLGDASQELFLRPKDKYTRTHTRTHHPICVSVNIRIQSERHNPNYNHLTTHKHAQPVYSHSHLINNHDLGQFATYKVLFT